MKQSQLSGRKLLLYAALFTLLFGLAAHGFRFFRLDYAHDACMVYQSDDVWQIRLGRYLMPVYARLRGQLVAPAWVGLLALSFLALAVYLVCTLLGLRTTGPVALTAGVMATCPSLTFSGAAYLPWLEIYLLAVLCATAGVWLWRRGKWGFIPAMPLLCVSIALYPSYLQAAAFLMLAVLAGECLDGEWNWKATVIRGLRALGALAGGLVLYAVSYMAVLNALQLGAGTTSNSVGHVADLVGADLLALLGETYRFGWTSLLTPATIHTALVAAINVALLLSVIPALAAALRAVSRPASRYVVLALALVLMPLAVNCVYFLAGGQVHALMTYPMALVPVVCLALWQRLGRDVPRPWVHVGLRAVAAGLAVTLFCAAAFSNQVYLKQALNADNTRATLTRVLGRIEQTPGYVPGQTPVALIGDLQNGPLAMTRPGFEAVSGVGIEGDFSVTHYFSYERYFQQVLGCPVALVSADALQAYAQDPQVQALEPFPALGCTVLLPDGTLALRLS